jgi:hypothetical protein
MKLTADLCLVLRLRIRGAVPPLSAFAVLCLIKNRDNFAFCLFVSIQSTGNCQNDTRTNVSVLIKLQNKNHDVFKRRNKITFENTGFHKSAGDQVITAAIS